MSTDQFLVLFAGLSSILFIVWFFWLGQKKGVRAVVNSSGYQEQMVLVKGGYTPDVILVRRGKPVRLNFIRSESSSCSEMVMFPDFKKNASLPQGETISIELLPDRVGEFEFQCQMGMLRGKLIVEE